jgi:hypothetical protein
MQRTLFNIMFYMNNFHILRLLPNWIYGMYIEINK